MKKVTPLKIQKMGGGQNQKRCNKVNHKVYRSTTIKENTQNLHCLKMCDKRRKYPNSGG